MSGDGVTRETIVVPGPRGVLAGELAYADGPPCGAALLVGPHPYMGGTMDNNVIAHLAGALATLGFVTLRFDYGEVAADRVAEALVEFWRTGHAPQDETLVAETVAAREWMSRNVGGPLVLVGYSFGAHAAGRSVDAGTSHVVLIAPTVKQHDFEDLRTCRVPKLVIFSNNDFATTQLATESWFAGLAAPKHKACLIGCDHFFKGREVLVARCVEHFLSGNPVEAGALS